MENNDLLNCDDSDPIFSIYKKKREPVEKENVGDLYQLSNNLYDLLNLKIGFILFLLYYILNSDIFMELGLNNIFSNAYDRVNDKITEKGIIISGMFLVLSYLLIDLLDKKKII